VWNSVFKQPEFIFSGYKGIEISRIIYEAKHLKTFAQITVLNTAKKGSCLKSQF